jgi:hypothetical protein
VYTYYTMNSVHSLLPLNLIFNAIMNVRFLFGLTTAHILCNKGMGLSFKRV